MKKNNAVPTDSAANREWTELFLDEAYTKGLMPVRDEYRNMIKEKNVSEKDFDIDGFLWRHQT